MSNELAARPDGTGQEDGARVLVVDDSSIERQALARLLRGAGYQVDEADGGEATLLFLRTRTPDILLLDLQMPGVDGFDVLAHLQKNVPDLPVIVMSGLPPDRIQSSIHRLPHKSLPTLVLKPIDLDRLLDVLALRLGGELPA